MKSWARFAVERFPLLSHLTMILLFVGAHGAVVMGSESRVEVWKYACVFLGILIFFFKMRLYDEIKDFELDKVINPDRPLPRGLLTLNDVLTGIRVCIFMELIFFAFLGIPALLCMIVSVAYSLLMYKEFFIPQWIRPKLTTYAMSHTVVTVPMGLSIFAGLTHLSPLEMPNPWVVFALGNWPLFNIFEFGRKTFATSEERNAVESYSKVFGRYGAVLLVLGMSVVSICIIEYTLGSTSLLQRFLFVALNSIGFSYAAKNSVKSADAYRKFSSAYIVLFYIFYLSESFYFFQGHS